MVITFALLAFVFAAVFFGRGDVKLVRWLKVSSLIAFISVFLLNLTGLIPDIAFGSGSTFSGAWNTSFGNFTAHVTDAQVGNLTGPLMFDMMEHSSFVTVGLAAVIVYLIWKGAGRVFTDLPLRRSVLTLMVLGAAWVFVIGTFIVNNQEVYCRLGRRVQVLRLHLLQDCSTFGWKRFYVI